MVSWPRLLPLPLDDLVATPTTAIALRRHAVGGGWTRDAQGRPRRAMPLFLNLLFSLAFAGAVGGAIHVWRTSLDAARRDGMQALAARRGWALTFVGEGLGRAGTLRLVPRGGLPWVAEARPGNGRPGGSVTDYEAEEPRWSEGTLLLAVAEPEGAPDPDGSAGAGREYALRGLLGDDLGRFAAHLPPVPGPEGMVALATGDPSPRVDLNDLGRALKGFVPVASGAKGRPVLILSPEGMRLRLRHPIKRPDQMERFLDLAFELSRLIGP